MKKERDNTGKKYDDDGTIDDGAKENVLRDNKYFYGFDENEDVTSGADNAYMDVLNKLTCSGMLPSSSCKRNGIMTLERMMKTTPDP